MSDILVECDRDRLEFMLNVLRPHLPQRILQYNFIHNYLHHYDRINRNREAIHSNRWNVRFYTHREGQQDHCTLVTISRNRDFIYCFTLQESAVELKECLQNTTQINWNSQLFSISCDERLFKMVNEVACHKVSFDWMYHPAEHIMRITKEQIAALPLNEKLPADMYIAPLDAMQHAEIIDDHWKYRDQNSLSLIRQSIELNGGVGLFRRGASQPICWITSCEILTPGFLYTPKSERGRGYGSLILKMELKRLLQIHNLDLFTLVPAQNKASLALHLKLGFKSVGTIKVIERPPSVVSKL